VRNKFGFKLVDDNADRLNVYSVVQVGSGVTPGVITSGSETLWLDNLESDAVGGACGVPDSSGIRMDQIVICIWLPCWTV
jgi:hypothetical protein